MSANYLSPPANTEDTVAILDNVSIIIENLQQITQTIDGNETNNTKKTEEHLLREYSSFQTALKHSTPKRNTSYSDIEGIAQVHGSPVLRRCNTGQSTSRPNIPNKSSKNNDGIEEMRTEKKSTFLRRYASFQSALRLSKNKRKSSDEHLEEVGKNYKERDIKSSLLRRYASFQSALRPTFNKKHSSSENLVEGNGQKERSPFLQRYGSFQSSLRPKFQQVSSGIKKLSCVTKDEEEEIPVEATFRHKSVDIGVGLTRRVSLFLFTKRTVCVHPYHPYTPAQSTRKIHFGFDSTKT